MEGNKVLFIDDELNILASLRRGLIDEEYTCFFTDNAQEALEIMEKNEISVVVTDMRMPKMNGLQFLKEIKEKYPSTIRMVMSGYTQLPQIMATINQGCIFKFIPKPWNLEEEFIPAINEGIKYYNCKKKNEQLSLELMKRNELYQSILRSTDAKFAVINKEMDMIKKISSYIFDRISQQIRDNNELISCIDIYNDLYSGFLNSLSSENVEFDLIRIITDLKTSIKNDRYEDKINVEITENSNVSCSGNYELFRYILYYSCRMLIKIGFNKISLIRLNLIKEEDRTNIKYVVLGQMKNQEHLYEEKEDILIMNKQINILHGYFDQLSKYIDGQIIKKIVDNNVLFEFYGCFIDKK